jgi:hypothetical protein
MTDVIRAYDAVVDSIDKKERAVVARIHTSDIDRFNSVIVTRAGRLDGYLKNPVVLWEHGKDPRRFTDPIGMNKRLGYAGYRDVKGVGKSPTELIAKTRFLEDDFSQQRYEWYRDEVLSAFSIRVLPNLENCGPATTEEIKQDPALGRGYYLEYGGGPGVFVYRDWELGEYSGTTVPGNGNALTVARMAAIGDLVSRSLLWLPDEARAYFDPAVTRVIVEKDGKFYVESEDGKNLGGPYGSHGEAAKRLEQVEYFKHKDASKRTMTDSEDGQATGGAALKPGRIKKVGAKYVVHDDDGKPVSEHDDPDEAQKAVGGICPKRSIGEPYIECDGQTWTLRGPEGELIVSSEDARLVEQAERALKISRTFDELNESMAASAMARNATIQADIAAMLDLALNGRV